MTKFLGLALIIALAERCRLHIHRVPAAALVFISGVTIAVVANNLAWLVATLR